MKNDCYRYAAWRNLLYRQGKKIEMMVSYEPAYQMMNEWFKQLFGESEGKEGKGIFPASRRSTFTTVGTSCSPPWQSPMSASARRRMCPTP